MLYHFNIKKYANQIISKYSCLKTELLSNKIHKLNKIYYTNTLRKCILLSLNTFIKSKYFAKERDNLNKKYKIYNYQPVSISHLIVLTLYTGNNIIQNKYKKYGFNGKNCLECYNHNVEIANYAKLLKECVIFFGDKVGVNNIYYHSISEKYVFRSLIPKFNAPISMLNNYNKAKYINNNINKNGILLKLTKLNIQNNNYNTDYCLNVKYISPYLSEEETLFYGVTSMSIVDVYTFNKNGNNKLVSNKDNINGIRIFFDIINGKYLTNINDEKYLINLIENIIHKKVNNKENNNIEYINNIFNNILHNWDKIFYINKYQINLINNKLKLYIFNTLIKYNTKFIKLTEYNWIIRDNVYKKLLNLSKFDIIYSKKLYEFNLKQFNDIKFRLYCSKYDITNDIDNNKFCFGISITSLPYYVETLLFNVHVYCIELNKSVNIYPKYKELQGSIQWFSNELFNNKVINNQLTFKVNIRLEKLYTNDNKIIDGSTLLYNNNNIFYIDLIKIVNYKIINNKYCLYELTVIIKEYNIKMKLYKRFKELFSLNESIKIKDIKTFFPSKKLFKKSIDTKVIKYRINNVNKYFDKLIYYHNNTKYIEELNLFISDGVLLETYKNYNSNHNIDYNECIYDPNHSEHNQHIDEEKVSEIKLNDDNLFE